MSAARGGSAWPPFRPARNPTVPPSTRPTTRLMPAAAVRTPSPPRRPAVTELSKSSSSGRGLVPEEFTGSGTVSTSPQPAHLHRRPRRLSGTFSLLPQLLHSIVSTLSPYHVVFRQGVR